MKAYPEFTLSFTFLHEFLAWERGQICGTFEHLCLNLMAMGRDPNYFFKPYFLNNSARKAPIDLLASRAIPRFGYSRYLYSHLDILLKPV